MPSEKPSRAKKIALVAVMAAALEGVKLALMALPNIEAVTLLCAAFGYVFGPIGIIATSLFVAMESLVFGVGPWVVSYAVHFNAVCVAFVALGRLKAKNMLVVDLVAGGMTAAFGALSALVDVGLFGGAFDDFGTRFAAYYARGAIFYVTHIAFNLVAFTLLFRPVVEALASLDRRCFRVGAKEASNEK